MSLAFRGVLDAKAILNIVKSGQAGLAAQTRTGTGQGVCSL